LTMPFVPDWVEPVWHLFVVRSRTRDQLMQRLNQVGISTLIHYPIPPHLQVAYADLGFGRGTFPIAERIHEEVLSMPIGPHISTDQTQFVVETIRKIVLCG